jgi:gamma-glutamyltranspeptidase
VTELFEIKERTVIEMHTGRPPTLAPRGMAACLHALASGAGVEILKAGDSAVVAVIAAGAAIGY